MEAANGDSGGETIDENKTAAQGAAVLFYEPF